MATFKFLSSQQTGKSLRFHVHVNNGEGKCFTFSCFLLVLCEAAASQPQPYLKKHEAEAVRLTSSFFLDKASLWLHTEQAVLIVFVILSKRGCLLLPFHHKHERAAAHDVRVVDVVGLDALAVEENFVDVEIFLAQAIGFHRERLAVRQMQGYLRQLRRTEDVAGRNGIDRVKSH